MTIEPAVSYLTLIYGVYRLTTQVWHRKHNVIKERETGGHIRRIQVEIP